MDYAMSCPNGHPWQYFYRGKLGDPPERECRQCQIAEGSPDQTSPLTAALARAVSAWSLAEALETELELTVDALRAVLRAHFDQHHPNGPLRWSACRAAEKAVQAKP